MDGMTAGTTACVPSLIILNNEQLEGEVDLDGLGWVANCLSLVDYHLTAQANDYGAVRICYLWCRSMYTHRE